MFVCVCVCERERGREGEREREREVEREREREREGEGECEIEREIEWLCCVKWKRLILLVKIKKAQLMVLSIVHLKKESQCCFKTDFNRFDHAMFLVRRLLEILK